MLIIPRLPIPFRLPLRTIARNIHYVYITVSCCMPAACLLCDDNRQPEDPMSAAPQTRRVALVLFEGFTTLDLYGPVQAFASCRVPAGGGG